MGVNCEAIRWRGLGRGVVLFGALWALGCGGQTVSVSGTVSFNGAPMKGGMVTFLSADKRAFQGTIDSEGHYKIDNVPVGEVKVAVNPMDAPRMNMGAGPGRGMNVGPPPGTANMPEEGKKAYPKPGEAAGGGPPEGFPDKFKDPEKSGIVYSVTNQANQTHDIKLP
jgi:hypothetical protein